MRYQPKRAVKAGSLVWLLALGACAGPHGGKMGHHMGGQEGGLSGAQLLQVQDRNRNGILDQSEKVQSLKVCTAEPCEVNVMVSANVAPSAPAGFDCGVSVDADIVIFGRQVSKLSWKLQAPSASANEYRFRPAVPGQTEPYAIYLYADTKNVAFAVADTPTEVVLTRKTRKEEGFNYGVYLDWRSKETGGAWRACNPLDPVIIEHN